MGRRYDVAIVSHGGVPRQGHSSGVAHQTCYPARQCAVPKFATFDTQRFNYSYSDDESRELAEPVKQLASQRKQVHAMFNNWYEDKAVQNAKRFMEMLGV